MDTKKLGMTVIGISLIFGLLAFGLLSNYGQSHKDMNCATSPECSSIGAMLNFSHLLIGIVFSAFSLGVYLLWFNRREEAFFDRTEKAIRTALDRIEKEKQMEINEDKFQAIMKAMTENEKKIFKAVKEQEGITQHTLRLRTGLSKAKVSSVLTDFHKKGLIKKEEKGKTFSVYLTEAF